MSRIIHRVFVSSTYEDLREERAEVQKALLKLDCFPVGMELFPSADDETWEFIKQQIDESDYYIVIVGGRYGSLAADGLSFTQKEYEYATEIGKPSIAFIHASPETLPATKIELDRRQREKLKLFIRQLQKFPTNAYTSPHELAAQVVFGLVNLRAKYPANGYIRSDEAVDLKKYMTLLEENANLKLIQSRSKALNTVFPGATELFEFTLRLSENENDSEYGKFSMQWKDVFYAIAGRLIMAPAQPSGLAHVLISSVVNDPEKRWLENKYLYEILRFFAGLNLVESKNYVDSKYELKVYWQLTEFGKLQFVLLSQNLRQKDKELATQT